MLYTFNFMCIPLRFMHLTMTILVKKSNFPTVDVNGLARKQLKMGPKELLESQLNVHLWDKLGASGSKEGFGDGYPRLGQNFHTLFHCGKSTPHSLSEKFWIHYHYFTAAFNSACRELSHFLYLRPKTFLVSSDRISRRKGCLQTMAANVQGTRIPKPV